MERKKILTCLVFVAAFLIIPAISGQAQDPDDAKEGETILVGRISHVEGELFRYVPEDKEWVSTVEDFPFGLNDNLYTNRAGKAEIIMPNNTWARMGGDTQIRLLFLEEDLTEIDVPAGTARFYNKGSDAVIRASTPFGYVTAPAETTFDLYVDDASVEVIALEGIVYFVHGTPQKRFEVIAGSGSMVSDGREITAGESHGNRRWEAWNAQRDSLWAKRMQSKGNSANYLPPSLYDHAYVLEQNGRWENVYYDGAYFYFWRPLQVSVGWRPFTRGRWTVWRGEDTWIPYEPFGYVTHHYGNWVYVRGFWYWAPPVVRVRGSIGPPLLNIGFVWYPGRVGWIHFGVNIGWFPLAPHEPYYGHHRWGPRTVVVKQGRIPIIATELHNYKYFNRAVILHRDFLYRSDNHKNLRYRNVGNTYVLKNYRVTPLGTKRVANNPILLRGKRRVTNIGAAGRGHPLPSEKIRKDRGISRPEAAMKPRAIERAFSENRSVKPSEKAPIRPKKIEDKEVPIHQIRKPVSRPRPNENPIKNRATLQAKDPTPTRGKVQTRQRKTPSRPVITWTPRKKIERGAVGQVDNRRWRASPKTESRVRTEQARSATPGDQGLRVRGSRKNETGTPVVRPEKPPGRKLGGSRGFVTPDSGSGSPKGWDRRTPGNR